LKGLVAFRRCFARASVAVEGGELEMYVLKGAEGKVVKSNPDLQPPLSTRPPAAKPKAKAVKPKAQAAKLRAKVAKPKAKVARPEAKPRNPKAAPAKPRAAAAVVKGGRKAKEQAKKVRRSCHVRGPYTKRVHTN